MRPLKQTLAEAVKGIVEAFASEEEEFSIYNITISLRDLINQGWITVEGLADTRKPLDLEDPTSREVDTQEVRHNEVRDAFLKLLFDGELDCNLIRGGKFSVYGVTTSTVQQPAPVQPTPRVNTQQAPAQPKVQVSVDVEDYVGKIVSYLDNKGAATLKQIQSRLKTNGITCADIRNSLLKISKVSLEAAENISQYIAKTK